MSNLFDIIQQKAVSHEDPVPHDAWDNIIKEKKKKRVVFFWLTAGMIAGGLLIAVSMYLNFRNTDTTNKTAAAEIVQNNDHSNQTQTIKNSTTVENLSGSQKENKTTTKEKLLNKNGAEIIDKEKSVLTIPVQQNNSTPTSPAASLWTEKSQRKIKADNLTQNILFNSGKNPSPENEMLIVSPGKKQQDEAIAATRRTQIRKQKSKIKISTEIPGTNELVETVEKSNDLAETQTGKIKSNRLSEAIIAEEENKLTTDETAAASSNKIKNDSAVVAGIKKLTVSASPENKKEKTTIKKTGGKHPWIFDIAVTPVLPLQEYDQSILFNRTLFSKNNTSEFSGSLVHTKLDPSLAFSIAARKPVNKKLSIGIGLQYLKLQEHVSISGEQTSTLYNMGEEHIDYVDSNQPLSDTVKVVLQASRQFSAINSYSFLSIPVSIQYNLLQKKQWSLGVTAGVIVQAISSYQNKINLNPDAPLINVSQKSSDKTAIGFNLFTGIRIGRTISKKIELFATPTFSYSPAEQNIKHSLFNRKIHQAGLSLGLSYKWK